MSKRFKIKTHQTEKQEVAELKENEVHIWSACLLEDKHNMDYFYSILSEDERERVVAFKFFKDQRRFTMTRGILRCLLSDYLGKRSKSIEIAYGLWGKPCLPEDKSLYFNVSHSGDYALYAVARSYEVGIDLEYIDKTLELEDMAFHIFSAAELTDWKTLDFQERIDAFFRRWVSWEAFLKASGKGWLEDKKGLITNIKNGFRPWNVNEEATNLYCFDCIPGYASALFVGGGIFRPTHCSGDQISLVFREAKNKSGKY